MTGQQKLWQLKCCCPLSLIVATAAVLHNQCVVCWLYETWTVYRYWCCFSLAVCSSMVWCWSSKTSSNTHRQKYTNTCTPWACRRFTPLLPRTQAHPRPLLHLLAKLQSACRRGGYSPHTEIILNVLMSNLTLTLTLFPHVSETFPLPSKLKHSCSLKSPTCSMYPWVCLLPFKMS